MHLDGSSTLESILTAAILAIAVPAILRRVSRWNDLARRFPATRDVGAAGVSFWHVILSVNGVSIPSRVLVTASGVRLSPTLIGALLFAEVFVPWDDLRIGSAHGQTRLLPAGQASEVLIRSTRVGSTLQEAYARHMLTTSSTKDTAYRTMASSTR